MSRARGLGFLTPEPDNVVPIRRALLLLPRPTLPVEDVDQDATKVQDDRQQGGQEQQATHLFPTLSTSAGTCRFFSSLPLHWGSPKPPRALSPPTATALSSLSGGRGGGGERQHPSASSAPGLDRLQPAARFPGVFRICCVHFLHPPVTEAKKASSTFARPQSYSHRTTRFFCHTIVHLSEERGKFPGNISLKKLILHRGAAFLGETAVVELGGEERGDSSREDATGGRRARRSVAGGSSLRGEASSWRPSEGIAPGNTAKHLQSQVWYGEVGGSQTDFSCAGEGHGARA